MSYVLLPATASALTTPRTAALLIADGGAFDIRMRFRQTTVASVEYLIKTIDGLTFDDGWRWITSSAGGGRVQFEAYQADGSTTASLATNALLGRADDTDIWMRTVYDGAGNISWFTSTDDTNDDTAVTWGAAKVSGAFNPATWVVGEADPIAIAAQDAAGNTDLIGRIYRQVWIDDGTRVFDAAFFDESTWAVDELSITEKANSATVTLQGSAELISTAPNAPTNPAASALSDSSIRVTWDDVINETGYRVERSLNGTTGWTDVSGNLAADTTQYDDTGLSASTQYFYRVVAFNAAGDSAPSTTVNATTDAPPAPSVSTKVPRSPRYGITRVASK